MFGAVLRETRLAANLTQEELAFRAGAKAFLRKPFNRDELLSGIKAVFSGKETFAVWAPA